MKHQPRNIMKTIGPLGPGEVVTGVPGSGWSDVFTHWRWNIEALTETDGTNTLAMIRCPYRPFAHFDISALFRDYPVHLPFPEGWTPDGERPPFPGTVFSLPWQTAPDIRCYIVFADYDDVIEAWVFHSNQGRDYGLLCGCAWWTPEDGWRYHASDQVARAHNEKDRDIGQRLTHQGITFGFAAMYLLSCKNVTTERVLPTRQQRRYYERRGEPIPNEHRIIVKVPGKGTHTLAGPLRPGEAQIPAHMVRGHFAEYTEERPLFGKYSGRFWIPAHVRGVGDAKPREYVVKPSGVTT